APVFPIAGAIAVGGFGLAATTGRAAWTRIACAATLGLYGAAISLARPGAGALAMTTLAVGGAMIGAAPRLAFTAGGRGARRVAAAAVGGGASALPGAAAFATAALPPAGQLPTDPGPILAAAYVAVAGTLGAAAIAQVARATSSPLPAVGATFGAI